MKFSKLLPLLIVPGIVLIAWSFKASSFSKPESKIQVKTPVLYPDGIYTGYSQSVYTSEPFWGYANIKIVNGSITQIYFTIRDSVLHETVDSVYGTRHYADIPLYMQQCINEEHGIEKYPQLLIGSQDIEKVDAISGATWSHNIFKATVKEAFKSCKNP